MTQRDEQYAPDGSLSFYIEWPDDVDGSIDVNGTVRAMTADERAEWLLKVPPATAQIDLLTRRTALAAKSITDLETSASQIDARAAVYEAFPNVATNGEALTRINVMTDDLAALARRVADLQQTVAHLIRLTVLG